ncbi:heavy-metal-associated domain-containing protein [Tamlana sp. s12]|uniref:heavy-metal-associated domain-containing protein n=1 Tax=Tamlana sp. s12 TaxID=1630406 RepID=UPI0007FC96D1|nr:heavy metal-associated domain-containing protein [Tamlana sp. s12]OBQ57240.1 heavy metal transporter [Tamlana sp. s12]QQY82572.1 heavy-metal-associated domain-containing protein [Tamlana sp. s12]
MKTLKQLFILTLITAFAFSCKNKNAEVKTVEVETATETTKELDPNATYAKAEFTIEGMTCAMGCAAQIQKKITKMEGVKSAKVDFDNKLAMVEYDEAKVTPASLEETVVKVSDTYSVHDMKTVDDFSAAKKTCGADCKGGCCKADKDNDEKIACKENCDKACCTKKAA